MNRAIELFESVLQLKERLDESQRHILSMPLSGGGIGTHAPDHANGGADEIASMLNPASTPQLVKDYIGMYASDTLRHSNDGEKYNDGDPALIKLKEMKINAAFQAFRVKFELKTTASSSYNANAKIYKNGVDLEGVNHTTNPNFQVYVTLSEDITGFVDGDLLQIYVSIGHANYDGYIQNMRIYYDPFLKTAPTNQDP